MKLLRFGLKGYEKPGILDVEGHIHDLSSIIDDDCKLVLDSVDIVK